MIFLKIILIITSIFFLLYFCLNVGQASGFIPSGEFGPDTFHSGLAAFIVLLLFIINISGVLLLFGNSLISIFKIALITLSVLWGCACIFSSVQIFLNLKRCFIFYLFLILEITITVVAFKFKYLL